MLRTSLHWAELVALLAVALPVNFSAALPITEEQQHQLEQGEKVYSYSHCYVCHVLCAGTLGPKLVGDVVLADKAYKLSQILIGRGEMPAYARKLSDEKIAAVAEYVRNSWGNACGGYHRRMLPVRAP